MRKQNLWFNQTGGVVTVAQHCDGSGISVDLTPGTYRADEIADGFNDQMSYINVPAGMKVTLYKHYADCTTCGPNDNVVVTGPLTANFCDDFPEFNDQMSEIVVASTDVTGDSDNNQDGSESAPQSLSEDLLSYIQDEFGDSGEDAQKIFDYANDFIITNESWTQSTTEKAAENGRTFGEQAMREARFMLKKSGAIGGGTGSEGTITPQPPAQAGLGTVPMIVIGVAVLGIGYLIYKRVSSSPQ